MDTGMAKVLHSRVSPSEPGSQSLQQQRHVCISSKQSHVDKMKQTEQKKPQRAFLLIEPMSSTIGKMPEQKVGLVPGSIPKVKKAFAALGLPQLVPSDQDSFLTDDSEKWRLALQSDKFSFLWSFRYTYPFAYKGATKFQRVNHIPAIAAIASEGVLYESYIMLQKTFGAEEFDFMPMHFALPRDMQKLQEAAKRRARDAPIRADDPYFGKRWLTKNLYGHRGIEIISMDAIERRDQQKAPGAVVECIEPLLIHGHKFDLGLYVAITSVSPLRFYVFNQVVHRACIDQYPTFLNSESPIDSYVIASNYTQFYEIDELKPIYKEKGLPSDTDFGPLHLDVVKDYMISVGLDGEGALRSMNAIILKMITGTAYDLRRQRGGNLEHPQRSVDLVRFDFVLDYTGKPFLMEVNLSPDLSTKTWPSGASWKFMKESVTHDFISMASLSQEFEWKDEIPYDDALCKAKCQGKEGQSLSHDTIDCWKCPGWYSDEERMQFAVSLAERASTPSRFTPLYPPTDPNSPYPQYVEDESRVERDLRWYLSHNGTLEVVCQKDDDCFGHGQCLDRKCHCDAGYEGPFCFLPSIPSTLDWTPKTVRADPVRSWWGAMCSRLVLCAIIYRIAIRSQRKYKFSHLTRAWAFDTQKKSRGKTS